ncbi:MAG: hypothetical protein QXO70_03495, partial [Candidatus Pacearchaeota archaeon]
MRLKNLIKKFLSKIKPLHEDRFLLDKKNIFHDSGFSYIYKLPQYFPLGDNVSKSNLMLFENNTPLTPHASHYKIRNEGKGFFSHWDEMLYFSSCDNSDPRTNNKLYSVTLRTQNQDKKLLLSNNPNELNELFSSFISESTQINSSFIYDINLFLGYFYPIQNKNINTV